MFCFYFKRLIKRHLDSDGAVPPHVVQHARKCRSCGELYYSHRNIAERLEAEYDRDALEIPDRLRERIMQACASAGKQAVKRPRRRVIRRILVASAAAAAVLLVLTVLPWGDRKPEEAKVVEVKTGGSQVVAWLLTRQPGTPADVAMQAETTLKNPKGASELDLSGGITQLVSTFDGVRIKR